MHSRLGNSAKELEEDNRSSNEYNTSMFAAQDDDASPSFASSFEKTPSQPYIPCIFIDY